MFKLHGIINIFLVLVFGTIVACKNTGNTKETNREKLSEDSLIIEKTIILDNVKGRIDHLAINDSLNILYIAELGNNSVESYNTGTGEKVSSIKNIGEPQFIIYIKKGNVICISSGESGECKFYDAVSFEPKGTIKLGSDADNMRYDQDNNLIYAGYGEGALGVIDAVKYSLVSDIKLSGHPESFQLDKNSGLIYVNVPESNCIEVADIKDHSVKDSWKLENASSNYPMAIDYKNKLLFIGCRKPHVMLIYDYDSGKEIKRFDIKGDADDLFYDSAHSLIYLTCGEGYLQVFKQESKIDYSLINEIQTSKGARTGLPDFEKGLFYLAEPENGDAPAKIVIYKIKH